MTKKAQSETRYIVFLVLFIAVMGIVNSIFSIESMVQTYQDEEDDTFWTWVKGLFSGFDDLIANIPIVGTFWTLINSSIQFIAVHDYLAVVLVALFGVPLGYIALRLVRGGG